MRRDSRFSIRDFQFAFASEINQSLTSPSSACIQQHTVGIQSQSEASRYNLAGDICQLQQVNSSRNPNAQPTPSKSMWLVKFLARPIVSCVHHLGRFKAYFRIKFTRTSTECGVAEGA